MAAAADPARGGVGWPASPSPSARRSSPRRAPARGWRRPRARSRRAGREGYAPERRRAAAARRCSAARRSSRSSCSSSAPGRSRSPRRRARWPPARSWRAGASATAAQVERSVPDVAAAVADAISSGNSVRAALAGASGSLEGPPARELARVGAELELGASDRRGARGPAGAPALAARRRPRLGAAEPAGRRRRPRRADAAARARRRPRATGSPTTPAPPPPRRASPGCWSSRCPRAPGCSRSCSSPGFVSRVLSDPAGAILIALAAALQVAGFWAIRRLGRPEEGGRRRERRGDADARGAAPSERRRSAELLRGAELVPLAGIASCPRSRPGSRPLAERLQLAPRLARAAAPAVAHRSRR